MKIYKTLSRAIALAGICLMTGLLTGCDKSESYSDLLRAEEKAVNWFLAQQRVEVTAPEKAEDFEVGPDAPYYRMDSDGTVYMQVINRGDLNTRPQEGDKVYFRFQRQNIKSMWLGLATGSEGNMDNLGIVGPTFLFYGNTVYPGTTQFGTGLQIPLDYLGYYSEVNLVVKSYSGFTGQNFQSEQSSCIPFLINVKYYRPEY
ncbi:MAG: DUF4827 domain-containing protein [Muribaculaceae bacterium]|nr:DUF4827 domain-containing protein [Muribaculaceae bacterium]